MTVTSLIGQKVVPGDGVTTEFDLDYPVVLDSQVIVTRIAADATETVLGLNVDYSVSGVGLSSLATITYPISGTPLPATEQLRFTRVTPAEQTIIDLTNNRAFNAEAIEQALDYLTLLVQDQIGLTLAQALNDDIIIGTNAQPYSARLAALAALVWQADQGLYLTGPNSADMFPLTSEGRTLLAAETKAEQRAHLELARGMEFITSQDLTSASEADFTEFDSTKYSGYAFAINLTNSADGNLQVRTSPDGGAAFDQAASDYSYGTTWFRQHTTPAGGTAGATTASLLLLNGTGYDIATAGSGIHAWLVCLTPESATETRFQWEGSFENSSGQVNFNGGGKRIQSEIVDALRFFPSTGTISGTITMYGLRSSA